MSQSRGVYSRPLYFLPLTPPFIPSLGSADTGRNPWAVVPPHHCPCRAPCSLVQEPTVPPLLALRLPSSLSSHLLPTLEPMLVSWNWVQYPQMDQDIHCSQYPLLDWEIEAEDSKGTCPRLNINPYQSQVKSTPSVPSFGLSRAPGAPRER